MNSRFPNKCASVLSDCSVCPQFVGFVRYASVLILKKDFSQCFITLRRRITVTSSLNEIFTDQLRNRGGFLRERGITPPAPTYFYSIGFSTDM
jgi:hypothetical protein